MKVQITGPVPDAVLHVARHMRAKDREEIFATRWSESYIDLAEDTITYPGPTWVGWADAEPVVVYGGKIMWPGVWSVFAYATDKFQQIGGYVTRHIRRVMLPSLAIGGAHRAQCYSLATHVDAHRWLKTLGATQEAALSGYGKGGQDFVVFGWTAETFDVFRRHAKGQQPADRAGEAGSCEPGHAEHRLDAGAVQQGLLSAV